jgi:hypothetical protein
MGCAELTPRSAIDLLNKMSGPGWFEKLRICGQVEDIYSRLAAAREKATDLVSVCLSA